MKLSSKIINSIKTSFIIMISGLMGAYISRNWETIIKMNFLSSIVYFLIIFIPLFLFVVVIEIIAQKLIEE